MPVHLNSLGMYGQDEPKPEWVSSACSCFFIELILKYPSVPQLEWKNSNAETFLDPAAVSKRQNKYYIITICNRIAIFKKSVSAIKHVITMRYSTVIYTTGQPNVSQTSQYSPLRNHHFLLREYIYLILWFNFRVQKASLCVYVYVWNMKSLNVISVF